MAFTWAIGISHFDTQNGVIPLIVSAEWGQTEVARQLLEAGANVNLQNKVQDHDNIANRELHVIYMYVYTCVYGT